MNDCETMSFVDCGPNHIGHPSFQVFLNIMGPLNYLKD